MFPGTWTEPPSGSTFASCSIIRLPELSPQQDLRLPGRLVETLNRRALTECTFVNQRWQVMSNQSTESDAERMHLFLSSFGLGFHLLGLPRLISLLLTRAFAGACLSAHVQPEVACVTHVAARAPIGARHAMQTGCARREPRVRSVIALPTWLTASLARMWRVGARRARLTAGLPRPWLLSAPGALSWCDAPCGAEVADGARRALGWRGEVCST